MVQGRHDRSEGRCRPGNEVKKLRIIDPWNNNNLKKVEGEDAERLIFKSATFSPKSATCYYWHGPTYLAFFHVFRLRTESRTALHLSKIQQRILRSKPGEITSNPGETDEKPARVDFATTPVTFEAAWLVCQNTLGQKHVGTFKLCSRLVLECYHQ